MKRIFIGLLFPGAILSTAAQAQTIDSLRLPDLRTTALAQDPRAAQLELLAAQSTLRLRNIDASLKPAFSIAGQGQYQSDVASIPISLPGVTLPKPPHDTYDAHVEALQPILDPTLSARRNVERAQTAESQARVRTALYSITESVNTAFFTALRAQSQVAELETTLTDVEAQLHVAEERVKAGTALPSEANLLRAELLRRRQAVEEQDAARRAAIAVLSDLTGKHIDPAAPLSEPDLTKAISTINDSISVRDRPEYEQFQRSLDVLEQTEAETKAQERPRLSAFGRAGYGKPGLNMLRDQFETYWLAGIQLQWNPFNWGSAARERQVTELQKSIVSTEEKTFTESLRRGVEDDIASIGRLNSALVEDSQIIALRESILAETRARYSEAVITSADYIDRQTDLLAARLSRASHRVELAQARAHLLTTLGIEVR
jgi:outer membrane protein TolC